MDHLAPPLAADQPMYEAMVTSTWLAAHTERLRIGRSCCATPSAIPAVLAREAVSIDHASGGRFELGIGWGSVPDEFGDLRRRLDRARGTASQRLRETLEVVRAPVARRGRRLRRRVPPPRGCAPGAAAADADPDRHRRRRPEDARARARVRRLVERARSATSASIDELRPQVGDARVSIQQMVALVARRGDREEVAALAQRRFGYAARSSARRPSSSTTSGGWPSRGSSASTRGSPTSPRPTRSPRSARR